VSVAVEMLIGWRNGSVWVGPGAIIHVDRDVALDLIKTHRAVPVHEREFAISRECECR
jgi:hypothetical protein